MPMRSCVMSCVWYIPIQWLGVNMMAVNILDCYNIIFRPLYMIHRGTESGMRDCKSAFLCWQLILDIWAMTKSREKCIDTEVLIAKCYSTQQNGFTTESKLERTIQFDLYTRSPLKSIRMLAIRSLTETGTLRLEAWPYPWRLSGEQWFLLLLGEIV